MYDFSDVEPQQSSDLIPDGTFAKVTMTIRPGGIDGQTEIDKGLLKASTTPGSDVLSLDCEFTVVQGRLVRRKFWQNFTVAGGKVDEKGASIGWNISTNLSVLSASSRRALQPRSRSIAARAPVSGVYRCVWLRPPFLAMWQAMSACAIASVMPAVCWSSFATPIDTVMR